MTEVYRTDDVLATKGIEFEDWNLQQELLMGIVEKGFENPSPIQEEVIPHILFGKDVLVRAKNGTGKTASFLIPYIERIDIDIFNPQVIIIVPTRELALQTSNVAKELGKFIDGFEVVCTTGGGNWQQDILRFKQKVHMVVATPGRLVSFLRRKIIKTNNLIAVVLDEADKLVSTGFREDIANVFTHLPEHETALFSASYPESVGAFVNRFMRSGQDLKKVNLMNELILEGVTQYYGYIDENQKLQCLHFLMTKLQLSQCVIFCNSVRRVELLSRKLTQLDYATFHLHSKMTQHERNRVFQDFRSGKIRFLVASDLITRGIDAPEVNVVFNFDFPSNAATYLHRIGRGGRFGTRAIAVNFVTDRDKITLYEVERELGVEILPLPEVIPVEQYS
ncbi:hypothetical protein PCE1_001751 [Barthelona sp. PCE]